MPTNDPDDILSNNLPVVPTRILIADTESAPAGPEIEPEPPPGVFVEIPYGPIAPLPSIPEQPPAPQSVPDTSNIAEIESLLPLIARPPVLPDECNPMDVVEDRIGLQGEALAGPTQQVTDCVCQGLMAQGVTLDKLEKHLRRLVNKSLKETNAQLSRIAGYLQGLLMSQLAEQQIQLGQAAQIIIQAPSNGRPPAPSPGEAFPGIALAPPTAGESGEAPIQLVWIERVPGAMILQDSGGQRYVWPTTDFNCTPRIPQGAGRDIIPEPITTPFGLPPGVKPEIEEPLEEGEEAAIAPEEPVAEEPIPLCETALVHLAMEFNDPVLTDAARTGPVAYSECLGPWTVTDSILVDELEDENQPGWINQTLEEFDLSLLGEFE